MEARQRPIGDWFTKIRTRQIVLPRFQRFEAWGTHEISALLYSVINDLPIGVTLNLGVGNKTPFKSRPMVGAPTEGERINELLLDGQQRLTALWRSIKGDYPDHIFMVDIKNPADDIGDEKLEFGVVPQARWVKNGRKYPLWVDDPSACWERGLIPVILLDPDDETAYQEWADSAAEGDVNKARAIERLTARLRVKVANFNLPYLFLPVETPKSVAVDVFIKLNTNVVPLSTFDILVAQLEEAKGESLHALLSKLKKASPRIDSYTQKAPVFLLSVAALLQDKRPSQKGFFGIDFDNLIDDWPLIEKGTKRLVDFLNEEKVLDRDRLPTQSVLAPLAALWANAEEESDAGGNTRVLLRRYLWRSFFTERYDSTVTTRVIEDYRTLKKALAGETGSEGIPCFNEEEYILPDVDVLKQARWPKYRDRLARAILSISLRGGAEDIADGRPVSHGNIGDREYHHIYPSGWLNNQGSFNEGDGDKALNCMLITWRTNREFSDNAPLDYLKEKSEASSLGESEIRSRVKTHFVDFDALCANDYLGFINSRANDYDNAIKRLCSGERWFPDRG